MLTPLVQTISCADALAVLDDQTSSSNDREDIEEEFVGEAGCY